MLSALTLNWYAVPFVRPLKIKLVAFTAVNSACAPTGSDVTLKVTSAAAAVPLLPFVQFTVASWFPAVAVPIVGALGAIPITSEELDDEAADSTPFEEIAVTVKVRVVPAVNPVTTIGLDAPVSV